MRYMMEFTVHGKGIFPLDMLRYDQCWPKTGECVELLVPPIEWSPLHEIRHLTLCKWCECKTDQPTTDRWKSFGWEVENVKVH